jgi:hypothetical protein
MTVSAAKRNLHSMRRALACAFIVLLGAWGSQGARSSGATIKRLDGTTIDATVLTERIEALTRAANVQGLAVTSAMPAVPTGLTTVCSQKAPPAKRNWRLDATYDHE